MKRYAILFLVWTAIGMVRAQDRETAQYLWVKETNVQSSFRAQMGLGLLDRKFNGSRGTPITNFFGADMALSSDAVLSIGLPLAGTISGGADNYGLGNIVVGGKYVTPFDRVRVAVGLDVALPTAQRRSLIGQATRPYVQFVKDQTAISPYVAITSLWDKVSLTADFGTDLQIYNNTAAGVHGRLEDILFYDAGFSRGLTDELFATLEFGGYSQLTYSGNNQTELFAGPGVRYQDHEMSAGFHILAPFRKPARDAIDFLAVFDLRVLF